MRTLVFLLLLPLGALAQPAKDAAQCADDYSDCHDNCALRFGVSTRDDQRIKLVKCMDKCKSVESECRERFFEAKNNGLETTEKPAPVDEGFRDDSRRKTPPPEEQPKKKKVEDDTTPKRTATKASELEPKKKDDKPQPVGDTPPAEKKAEKDPRYDMKFEPAKEPEKKKAEPAKQARLDSDVRSEDESQKKSSPPPEKTKSSSDEQPKKEKKRALDEWDPEAL